MDVKGSLRRMRSPLSLGIMLLLSIGGDARPQGYDPGSPQSRIPSSVGLHQPILAGLERDLREEIESYLADRQGSVIMALSDSRNVLAKFKLPMVLQGLTDPWVGLSVFERYGLRIADASTSDHDRLGRLLQALDPEERRVQDRAVPDERSAPDDPSDLLASLRMGLEEAHHLREQAVQKLGFEDRRFLFQHAASIVEHFLPQIADPDESAALRAEADARFCRIVAEQIDGTALLAAARVLTRFADAHWWRRMQTAFADAPAVATSLSGVTGDILFAQETPYGLIIIGGRGPNRYHLHQPVAFLLDLGGDDVYHGLIAAAADPHAGNSVVIDLSGNDAYYAAPLGLATGRLGVGVLIDREGDDMYHLSDGAGGVGLAGLGILYDMGGNDRYHGSRFTQGAAVGGLGLLLDDAGDDAYTSFGYAVGFGGPLGVAAVVDASGDDSYRCGEKYASTSNAIDAPDAEPGDPRFQYDCFGLGVGSGRRIVSQHAEHRSYALAGGIGMLIDRGGHDRYRSSNFSQGTGYFFGAGVKLDLSGNDEHEAARYGHAAAAHYSIGLFIDYHGHDRYTSTGPFYNGGAAWDHSVAMGVDAGHDGDVYDLQRSDGLGRADYDSWSLFLEEGGHDRYAIPRGLGRATENSMSGFIDLAGEDDYTRVSQSGTRGRGNRRTLIDQGGGFFIDR